ncbi:alpha/beta-hydrolase [Periconia macrospinosa]|uniref:Alpha/beta-hydrolase n=1 Tax=Periconia macrospinosa TaxID=97972 RepID=A0A2V1DFZ2_9PLEO|nr:alpha/beta-hydrolase [Periconia macrospinosa]
MRECYSLWRTYFDKANALLDIPGTHHTIPTPHGFSMPAILFRAAGATRETPRPLLIIGGGFESSMEETFHVSGFAALERGYNVLIYEGPGHRGLVNQGVGFVFDWEKAVTPIMDFVVGGKEDGEFGFVDTEKIGLMGMSMGGYLAARAAAFEPRLAAVMCIDGVYSMLEPALNIVPEVCDAWEAGDAAAFDAIFEADREKWGTGRRWFHDDLLYTFCTDSGFEAFKVCERMTLEGGVAGKVKMPAYIGDAADDLFFEGQPERVKSEMGANATLKEFRSELGAHLHCQSGALVYMNQDMLEWFAGVVGH